MKKIYLLIILLLVTGCSANYEIEINPNSINEIVTIYNRNANVKEIAAFTNDFNAETDDYNENIEIYKIESDNDKLVLNYDYNNSNYKDSTILNVVKNDVSINSNSIVIKIDTFENLFRTHLDLDDLTIKVKSDYIINGNYEKKEDNIYYWSVNRDNAKDKSLKLVIDKKYTKQNNIKLSKETSSKIVKYFYYLLGVSVIILVLFLVKKYQKNK